MFGKAEKVNPPTVKALGPVNTHTAEAFGPTTVRIFDTRLSNHSGGATATVVDAPTVLAPGLSAFSYASATVGQGGAVGVDAKFYLAPGSDPARGGVGVSETKSPFDRSDTLRARSAGTRHVCTYLYPRFTHASDATQPIARADKRYTVTK